MSRKEIEKERAHGIQRKKVAGWGEWKIRKRVVDKAGVVSTY